MPNEKKEMTLLDFYPHVREKLLKLTVGGVPLLLPTGEFNPKLLQDETTQGR
jgi:hypothetical protein